MIPGLITAVINYYKLKVPKMKTHEKLTAVASDEIDLCERGNLDVKYDL